ncbi:hypothetical protein [Actinacidiphila sp. bgisy167]|uniref:hypothetical protein n=1 Tax=Actinacidiphila sp. bgisy167 TaxID=3413797 RepID=UPI003D75EE3F
MSSVRRHPGVAAAPGIPERTPAFSLKRWAPRPPARVDPALGEPALARLRTSAAAADWPAVKEQLSAVTDGWELSWLVDNALDVGGYERWLPKVVEAEPECGTALLVAGARQVQWAWEARTRARASQVSQEQFRVFHERLEAAEDLLYRAAEREPESAAPWYFLQRSGRGLGVGADLARLRFEATVRRCPGHLGAHLERLQQVCRKWGGSYEEMHAFARESMLGAPEGSALGVLVAVAHLEHWLDLEPGRDSAYILSDAVAEQLHEAADRSVRHPAFGRPTGWAHVLNTFAMSFSLTGENPSAAAVFAALGGLVTADPWEYLDSADPRVPYRAMRSAAGRH